jgi:hypothetical protein
VANLIRNRSAAIALALAIGATVGWLASLALAGDAGPAILDGLAAPRGLSPTSDGSLLIAEGGAGRLLKWNLSGNPEVLSDEFPYLAVSGIQGESASGISAALEVGDGSYYVIVGEARAKGHQELYSLTPSTPPVPVTGQDVQGFFPPQPITNPFDLALMPSGDVLVTDSGRNSVLRVTPDGDVADYARLPAVEVPNEQEAAQPVPTGAVWGPDGALYVATLTGWPHPAGAAVIYRVADANGDGDALDDGEVTPYATGLSAATDVVFEEDGSLLITEFSTNMSALVQDLTHAQAVLLPGRLVRRAPDGTISVVAENLVGPTGVALIDGRIFVSEEFAGRVVEVGSQPGTTLGPVGWLLSIIAGVAAALVVGARHLFVLRSSKRGQTP